MRGNTQSFNLWRKATRGTGAALALALLLGAGSACVGGPFGPSSAADEDDDIEDEEEEDDPVTFMPAPGLTFETRSA